MLGRLLLIAALIAAFSPTAARAQTSSTSGVLLLGGSNGGYGGWYALTGTGKLHFFTYGRADAGWQRVSDLNLSASNKAIAVMGGSHGGYGGAFVLSERGDLWFFFESPYSSGNIEWRFVSSLALSGTIVATGMSEGSHGDGHGGIFVATDSGDIYFYTDQHGDPAGWVLMGSLPPDATPATQETWGAVKSRYRGERGAAQPR